MRGHQLFAIALFLSACADTNGTSTGNPVPIEDAGRDAIDNDSEGNGGLATGGYCAPGAMTQLALEEDSPLGFSAADILAFAEGTHEEALRWNPQEGLTLSPESGEQEITITVTSGSEARFVEPKPPGGGNGAEDLPLTDIESNCVSWIEIDVEVTVESSGGALDESFDAVLRAHHPLSGSIYHAFELEDVQGELDIATTGSMYEGFAVGELWLSLRFSPYGAGGVFSGYLRKDYPEGFTQISTTMRPFADFGAGTCGDNADGFTIGVDDAIEGATLQDALDMFNADAEVGITWEDGASTTSSLAFAPDVQGGCVVLDNEVVGDLTLLSEGTLTMTSEDGRLDAAWPGRIEAHVGDDGAIDRIVFMMSGKLPSHTMTGASALYGFPNEDISSFDAAGPSANVTVTSAGIEGAVGLTGYVFADCDTAPPDQPADGDADPGAMGGGSGGCRGADPVTVASGTLD